MGTVSGHISAAIFTLDVLEDLDKKVTTSVPFKGTTLFGMVGCDVSEVLESLELSQVSKECLSVSVARLFLKKWSVI